MRLVRDEQKFFPDLYRRLAATSRQSFHQGMRAHNWVVFNTNYATTLVFNVGYNLVTVHYQEALSSFEVEDLNHFNDLLKFARSELGMDHPIFSKIV
jgi:hypothetical protein